MLMPSFSPISSGVTKAYIGGASDTTNATVYTFSGQSIGAASSSRYVVVCAGGEGSTNRTISGITCGGVAMTQAVKISTAQVTTCGIYILNVAAGTTADIVVTYSGGMTNCRIEVYTLNGLSSATPADTLETVTTDDNPSGAIDFKGGGAVIGIAVGASAASMTWTNLSEDADTYVETAVDISTASASPASDSTPTVSVTLSATTGDNTLAIASWL